MTLLTCAAVRRRLPAFYDRELPIPELIAIESHISATARPVPASSRTSAQLGDALRCAAAPGPADDWTGLQSGVISRMRAEAHESWPARTRRMFDDMHLVWIGFAVGGRHLRLRRWSRSASCTSPRPSATTRWRR